MDYRFVSDNRNQPQYSQSALNFQNLKLGTQENIHLNSGKAI